MIFVFVLSTITEPTSSSFQVMLRMHSLRIIIFHPVSIGASATEVKWIGPPDICHLFTTRVKMSFASNMVHKGACLCGHPWRAAENQVDVAR